MHRVHQEGCQTEEQGAATTKVHTPLCRSVVGENPLRMHAPEPGHPPVLQGVLLVCRLLGASFWLVFLVPTLGGEGDHLLPVGLGLAVMVGGRVGKDSRSGGASCRYLRPY